MHLMVLTGVVAVRKERMKERKKEGKEERKKKKRKKRKRKKKKKKKKKKKQGEKEVFQFYIYKLPIDRPAAATGNFWNGKNCTLEFANR